MKERQKATRRLRQKTMKLRRNAKKALKKKLKKQRAPLKKYKKGLVKNQEKTANVKPNEQGNQRNEELPIIKGRDGQENERNQRGM